MNPAVNAGLAEFLAKARQHIPLEFAETLAVIATHYHYQPTAFSNGLDSDRLQNPAGSNEGSCKVFAFAQLHQLDEATTLHLFGEHYRAVIVDPEGAGHQNIRHFLATGWPGIRFDGIALTTKA